ncbi:type VI secretion system ATPase TssH [Burkholderia ambifaria]|uniref:Type VI secretion ATPase, ClpV1 family n=1 Tax=Burkholderia ambifaria MEX-5 TaxID=396597 RepID=B1T5J0_9BURK|nr:type VI secretion system ATPase TssH [Burkholderia ambifaria]EDT41161.1 type VI secretion ATPase, ClpV1 family [Burkholderia ambifaria MEX-5]
MAEISRATLFGKLNALGFRSIESGTVFCKLRGNPCVELEHWLHQILQGQDSDLNRIVRHFDVDAAALARDLTQALDRLPRGAGGAIDLSSQVEEAVERGWVYGSLLYGATRVRTGHLLIGMLKTPSLRRSLLGVSRQFEHVKLEPLVDDFGALLAASPEARDSAPSIGSAVPGEASGAMPPAPLGQQAALARYTVDLTALAREGKLDPIMGRDEEIRQVSEILMRRRQNNPILTGEAGVGKTAVVEGLAQRIIAGDVPPALRDVVLRTLDVGLLQAGASMKGEFEQRLRQVIEEVQAAQQPVILFIDEAHTLVGAGGAAGTGDAANLLKPALARGTLRTIAATTWAEYKKHIEKDPALTRRFQSVAVAEPDEAKALRMLRGLIPAMESHHGVQVLDEALEASVQLSHRYIADRQLPDKAVSLLDTVCARVAASQHATPPALERARATIAALEAELALIEREAAVGIDRQARAVRVEAALADERARRDSLEARWLSAKELVSTGLAHRARLRELNATRRDAEPTLESERAFRLSELERLERELHACQGETPLVLASVDRHAVTAIVQDWTGIPVGRMVGNEIDGLLNLADTLDERIIGQPHATRAIARRVQIARAGLDRPGRPVGVFLLAGPSGVGKTETALALADALYGGEHNLITINMSEYQEPHTVSTLKGAPPGYVGYGEGGVLTEAVRRRPYSVLLLDEVEKAHPDVHEVFYQVFDKGWMEDGEGRLIDFRNTLILLTTNAGSESVARLCADPERAPEPDALAAALREPLLRVFPPALLGRMTVVPYYPLGVSALTTIARLQIERLGQRMQDSHGIALWYGNEVVQALIERCDEPDSGARLIDAVLTQMLLPQIGRAVLQMRKTGQEIDNVEVGVEEGRFVVASHKRVQGAQMRDA